MKFLGASLFLFLISAVVGSAQAACGGGGWHSSTSSASTSVRETPVVSSSEDRHVVSASVGTAPRNSDTARPAKNDDPAFNTARFDSVAPRLNLSQKQLDRIEDVKAQVREDLQDLRHAVNKAEVRLARCYGNCDDEKQNLTRANEAMKNFTGSVEFERRLNSILSQEQLATYHDADSAR